MRTEQKPMKTDTKTTFTKQGDITNHGKTTHETKLEKDSWETKTRYKCEDNLWKHRHEDDFREPKRRYEPWENKPWNRTRNRFFERQITNADGKTIHENRHTEDFRKPKGNYESWTDNTWDQTRKRFFENQRDTTNREDNPWNQFDETDFSIDNGTTPMLIRLTPMTIRLTPMLTSLTPMTIRLTYTNAHQTYTHAHQTYTHDHYQTIRFSDIRKNRNTKKTLIRSPSESWRKNWTGKSSNHDGKGKGRKATETAEKTRTGNGKLWKSPTPIATATETFMLFRRLFLSLRRNTWVFALFRFPSWLGKFSTPLSVAIRTTTEFMLFLFFRMSGTRIHDR